MRRIKMAASLPPSDRVSSRLRTCDLGTANMAVSLLFGSASLVGAGLMLVMPWRAAGTVACTGLLLAELWVNGRTPELRGYRRTRARQPEKGGTITPEHSAERDITGHDSTTGSLLLLVTDGICASSLRSPAAPHTYRTNATQSSAKCRAHVQRPHARFRDRLPGDRRRCGRDQGGRRPARAARAKSTRRTMIPPPSVAPAASSPSVRSVMQGNRGRCMRPRAKASICPASARLTLQGQSEDWCRPLGAAARHRLRSHQGLRLRRRMLLALLPRPRDATAHEPRVLDGEAQTQPRTRSTRHRVT